MGLITKLFGTRSEREVKKLMSTIDRIEAMGGYTLDSPGEIIDVF